jgi:integrase
MNVTVYTRHSDDCPHKQDRNWRRCRCPKWLTISRAGGFIRQSAKTRSWEQAETKAKKLEQEADQPRSAKTTERTTIKSAVEQFLKNKQVEGVSKESHYNQDLALRRQFLEWTKRECLIYLDEITLTHLEKFRAALPVGGVTRRNKQTLLRSFFRYCAVHRWIDWNPALGLSRIRVREEPTLPFEPSEYAAIRELAMNHYRRQDLDCITLNARLLAFVECLRWSGLRIGDAIKLERTRLDSKNRIQLHQEKTGVFVFVPIPAAVADAMRMLPGDRYFFWDGHSYEGTCRNYQYRLKSLFKRAGVPHGHAHMFRDTFAVELLKAGVELEKVSKLLGHTSVKTTEKHYSPWVKSRQVQIEADVHAAWTRMDVPHQQREDQREVSARVN